MQRFEAQVQPAQVVAAVHRDGCAVIEGLLDEPAVAALGEELDGLLAEVGMGSSSFLGFRTQRIFSPLARTRALDRLAVHPLILEVLGALLTHLQLSAPVVVRIHPGEVAQTLHRDATSYPLRRHDGGELVVNVIWAVDDFTAVNGATRMIEGSHRWDEESAAREEDAVVATMPRGSACVFLGSLMHGGGANRSGAPRTAVIMEYAAAWLRSQENFGLSISVDTARRMPRRLAELIGYDLYPPFLGYVDGRNPRTLLDAPA